jgi:hypothetical protein
MHKSNQQRKNTTGIAAHGVAASGVTLDGQLPSLKRKSLTPLAVTFAVGGIWDTIAGFLYIFFIGTGRVIDGPPIDPFFAVFLGSFFLCFAYLQLLSAVNIERYALNVGCLILGRVFYVVQLYVYMSFVEGFPSTFWFTGIVDSVLIVSYVVLAYRAGLSARDLFLPQKTGKPQHIVITGFGISNTVSDERPREAE